MNHGRGWGEEDDDPGQWRKRCAKKTDLAGCRRPSYALAVAYMKCGDLTWAAGDKCELQNEDDDDEWWEAVVVRPHLTVRACTVKIVDMMACTCPGKHIPAKSKKKA
eukprot:gene264-6092_t